MKKVRYAIALAVVLQAAPAAAQALWHGTEYGMSPAQVLAQFPQARVPDSPDALAGGENEGLRLDEAQIAGHRFQASFFFAGDALVQVTLSQQASRAGRADLQVFEDVAATLRARHGPPSSSEQRASPFERRSRTWQVDGARVALVLVESGADSLVNVVYQVRPPEAAPPVRLRSEG